MKSSQLLILKNDFSEQRNKVALDDFSEQRNKVALAHAEEIIPASASEDRGCQRQNRTRGRTLEGARVITSESQYS